MNCEEVKTNINDFLDGFLTPASEEAVKTHIKTCNTCSKEHKALLMVADAVAGLQTLKTSPDFNQKVLAALEANTQIKAAPSLRWILVLGSSFAGIWIAVLSWFAMSNLGGHSAQTLLNLAQNPAQGWLAIKIQIAKNSFRFMEALSWLREAQESLSYSFRHTTLPVEILAGSMIAALMLSVLFKTSSMNSNSLGRSV